MNIEIGKYYLIDLGVYVADKEIVTTDLMVIKLIEIINKKALVSKKYRYFRKSERIYRAFDKDKKVIYVGEGVKDGDKIIFCDVEIISSIQI